MNLLESQVCRLPVLLPDLTELALPSLDGPAGEAHRPELLLNLLLVDSIRETAGH